MGNFIFSGSLLRNGRGGKRPDGAKGRRLTGREKSNDSFIAAEEKNETSATNPVAEERKFDSCQRLMTSNDYRTLKWHEIQMALRCLNRFLKTEDEKFRKLEIRKKLKISSVEKNSKKKIFHRTSDRKANRIGNRRQGVNSQRNRFPFKGEKFKGNRKGKWPRKGPKSMVDSSSTTSKEILFRKTAENKESRTGFVEIPNRGKTGNGEERERRKPETEMHPRKEGNGKMEAKKGEIVPKVWPKFVYRRVSSDYLFPETGNHHPSVYLAISVASPSGDSGKAEKKSH